MWLKPRKSYIRDSRLTPGTVALLGTSVPITIDRTWPLEEVRVMLYVTTDSTAPTITNLVDASLNYVKRITLETNDGVQPRKVVDYSGVGLIESALQLCGNVNRETAECRRLVAASTTYRITYRVPLVHPSIYGPLRTQMLLPVHIHPQDPKLTIDFNPAASCYSGNAPTVIGAEVVLLRREMTKAVNDAVLANGGYIPMDLVESSMTFPLTGAEFRFPIPTPGAYANLLIRGYLGGANVTRGDVGVTTVGSEGTFRLESGGTVISEWKSHQLRSVNEDSQTGDFDNPAGTTMAIARWPGQWNLDFLTDGIVDADELGSLLDCNLPAASGLKMELIGTTATVATNASTLYVGGYRYFGDLSRWQSKK